MSDFHPIVCANVCADEKNGAPGAIPTRDLPLRRRTLYAAELREHKPPRILKGKSAIVKRPYPNFLPSLE